MPSLPWTQADEVPIAQSSYMCPFKQVVPIRTGRRVNTLPRPPKRRPSCPKASPVPPARPSLRKTRYRLMIPWESPVPMCHACKQNDDPKAVPVVQAIHGSRAQVIPLPTPNEQGPRPRGYPIPGVARTFFMMQYSAVMPFLIQQFDSRKNEVCVR